MLLSDFYILIQYKESLNKPNIKSTQIEEIKLIIAGIEGEVEPLHKNLSDYFSDKANNDGKGALYTSKAFESAIYWFPYILMIVVFLFSYSTMISWYYYGEKGWKYLSKSDTSIRIYQIIFLSCTFLGSIASMNNVKNFSDMMILSCAFPNIIGAMFLIPSIKEKLNDYWSRYQAGEFKNYK